MTVAHGPVVIRRRLGHVLKQLRVGRDLQLSQVARQLEVSPSKLSRIETGQVEPKLRDVRDLLEIYRATDDVRRQVMDWAGEAKSPGWWQPFTSAITVSDLDMLISLETEARAKYGFSLPVPGLLQTEAYALTTLAGALPDQPAPERRRFVDIRLGRQEVIAVDREDVPPLELHAVLDEVALHRCEDRDVLDEQLHELVRRSEQPNITLQVLPLARGWTPASSTFSIFEPRDPVTDWPVVNVESTGDDTYVDATDDVALYQAIWRAVTDRALDPERSRELISSLARR